MEDARAGGGGALLGLAVHDDEGRAEHLVARDDAVQRAPQRLAVQLTTQPQPLGDVVGGAELAELLQEPEPLLSERQRQAPAALHRLDRRELILRRPARPPRE